jgi:hypothetical protein
MAEAIRLHRGVLQPGAQATLGVLEPRPIREGSTDAAGSSLTNLSTESGQAQKASKMARIEWRVSGRMAQSRDDAWVIEKLLNGVYELRHFGERLGQFKRQSDAAKFAVLSELADRLRGS